MAACKDRGENFELTGIKHVDRAEIFSAITGLPPWLDGPRIKAKAKKEGISYDEAKGVLEATYG